MRFRHYWELYEDGENTRLVQREEYRGIGVLFWDYTQMKAAYQKSNLALKNYIEAD